MFTNEEVGSFTPKDYNSTHKDERRVMNGNEIPFQVWRLVKLEQGPWKAAQFEAPQNLAQEIKFRIKSYTWWEGKGQWHAHQCTFSLKYPAQMLSYLCLYDLNVILLQLLMLSARTQQLLSRRYNFLYKSTKQFCMEEIGRFGQWFTSIMLGRQQTPLIQWIWILLYPLYHADGFYSGFWLSFLCLFWGMQWSFQGSYSLWIPSWIILFIAFGENGILNLELHQLLMYDALTLWLTESSGSLKQRVAWTGDPVVFFLLIVVWM